jgi:hypothetical protein
MTLEEIRVKKKTMESAIAQAVIDFRNDTGVEVKRIDVSFVEMRTLGGKTEYQLRCVDSEVSI